MQTMYYFEIYIAFSVKVKLILLGSQDADCCKITKEKKCMQLHADLGRNYKV